MKIGAGDKQAALLEISEQAPRTARRVAAIGAGQSGVGRARVLLVAARATIKNTP